MDSTVNISQYILDNYVKTDKVKLVSDVRGMIIAGADINIKNKSGKSALFMACGWHYIDMFDMLMEHGADPNTVDSNGIPVITTVATYRYNQTENTMIKQLVNAGAETNVIGHDGQTFINNITALCDVSLIEFLIGKGMVVNFIGDGGWSALHIASKTDGGLPVVKCLLKHGADINYRRLVGDTPIMTSTNFGKYDITKYLLDSGADVNITNNNGDNALLKLLVRNILDNELLIRLIDLTGDINVINKQGSSPLFSIAISPLNKSDNADVTIRLLDKRADISSIESLLEMNVKFWSRPDVQKKIVLLQPWNIQLFQRFYDIDKSLLEDEECVVNINASDMGLYLTN